MRIEVFCPECGRQIKIDIHKIERLEREVAELKQQLKELKGRNPIYTDGADHWNELLKVFGM
jgi:uncharacterized Zn finger protein (UPF0148 family)